MFSTNNQISNRQLRRLIIIELFSGSAVLIPYIAVTYGGNDGIIGLIMAVIGTVIYGSAIVCMSVSFKYGFVSQLKSQTGEILSTVILALYVGRFLVRGSLLLMIFKEMVGTTILRSYSTLAIIIPMVIVCAYGGSRKMEDRARLIELLFWIIMIPIIILLIMALKNVNLSYVTPDYSNGFLKNIKTEYILMMLFLPIEFLLFNMPYVKKNSGRKKHAVAGILVAVLLNLLVYIVVVGILGVKGTEDSMLSTLNIMQAVDIPFGLLERFDIFMIIFWIMGLFAVISGYMFYSVYILNRMLPTVNKYILLAGVMVVIVVISVAMGDGKIMLQNYISYAMYFDMPVALAVPLILFVAGKRLSHEKDNNS